VLRNAEGAADLLLGPGHSDVALGAVVGERHLGLSGEAQDFGLAVEEGLVQFSGPAFRYFSASALAGQRLQPFRPTLRRDGIVEGRDALEAGCPAIVHQDRLRHLLTDAGTVSEAGNGASGLQDFLPEQHLRPELSV